MSKFGLQKPADLSQNIRVVIKNINNLDILKKGEKDFVDKNVENQVKTEQSAKEIQSAKNIDSVKEIDFENKEDNSSGSQKTNPVVEKKSRMSKQTEPLEENAAKSLEFEKLMAKLRASARKVNAEVSNRTEKYQVNIFDESREIKISESVKTDFRYKAKSEPLKHSNRPGINTEDAAGTSDENNNSTDYGSDENSNKKDSASYYKNVVSKPQIKPGSNSSDNKGDFFNEYNPFGEQGTNETSNKIPGIISKPDLDARHLLNKGEYHFIRLQGKIDANGFIKEIYVIKASEFLKLNNLAKQHVSSNWRWAPGYDNAVVTIDLRVERK
ncbi:MAG TPA: hypothetical protein PKY81_00475 [bacterium]|nr:hypothetical protein [bacterium]HPN29407.1 hypothetical protein [bacterium]